MFELIKIVHFLSFSVAIGAGVSNIFLGTRLASFPPPAMPMLGGYRLLLGQLSTIGLVLLWLTGIAMLSMTSGLQILSNSMFLWKLAAVIVLSLFSILANVTILQAKKAGGPPNAQRMKQLGIGSQAMAILAVILAVLAFR